MSLDRFLNYTHKMNRKKDYNMKYFKVITKYFQGTCFFNLRVLLFSLDPSCSTFFGESVFTMYKYALENIYSKV